MENEVKKWLFDILSSINDIENFLGDEKLYSNYCANKLVKSGVERKIEIIGEAVNRILKSNPNISITNARRIVDARNKIIHGYDEIEDVNIWAIIINHLPILKSEAEQLLSN